MTVEETVKKILLEILDITEEDVVPSATFVDDLGANSVDMVEVLADLENEYNIEIPDDDVKDIKTVQDIVSYIKTRIGKDN